MVAEVRAARRKMLSTSSSSLSPSVGPVTARVCAPAAGMGPIDLAAANRRRGFHRLWVHQAEYKCARKLLAHGHDD